MKLLDAIRGRRRSEYEQHQRWLGEELEKLALEGMVSFTLEMTGDTEAALRVKWMVGPPEDRVERTCSTRMGRHGAWPEGCWASRGSGFAPPGLSGLFRMIRTCAHVCWSAYEEDKRNGEKSDVKGD